jgi:osmotically-inducible protein OsmY
MVREHFQKDSRLASQCIDVEVTERYITLVGCADSEELKRIAEEIAEGVSGVMHVENHILVRGRTKAKVA